MPKQPQGSTLEEWMEVLERESGELRAALGELVNASIQARAHISARRSVLEGMGAASASEAVERTLHELDCAIAAAQGLL